MLRLVRNFKVFSTSKAINWSQPTTHSSYYEVLGVSTTASADQIKEAYRKLVELYHPGLAAKGDPKKFQSVNEAYVILSNDQTKRAYDLLQREGHNKTHLSVTDIQQRAQTQKTQLEVEKDLNQAEERKKLNIDQFGRYKGGLPKYKGWTKRGGALGAPGSFHDQVKADAYSAPDYQSVDAGLADSFKNFHQNEREYRTARWVWIRAEIDYNYFSLKRVGRPIAWLRNFILLFWIAPYFIGEYIKWNGLKRQNAVRQKHGLEPVEAYRRLTF